jgi:hypothetical protein
MSSDEEHEDQHPHKKMKHVNHDTDEEVEVDQVEDEEPEVVDDEDEAVAEEEGEKVSCSAAVQVIKLMWMIKEASDLEEQHHGEIPDELIVKNDTTKDLLTIFSDRLNVNFKKRNKITELKGRWCLPCR